MLGGLYKKRWQAFIDVLTSRLKGNELPLPDYYEIDKAWTLDHTKFPSTTIGDPVKTATEIFNKYFNTPE